MFQLIQVKKDIFFFGENKYFKKKMLEIFLMFFIFYILFFVILYHSKCETYENEKKYKEIQPVLKEIEPVYKEIQLFRNTMEKKEEKSLSKLLANIPIYYINLEKSIERKKKLENNLKKWNIQNYQRINAVYGKDYYIEDQLMEDNMTIPDIDIPFQLNMEKYQGSFTPGELGCTLSHIKAIKTAYEENKNNIVMICEDDISFDLLPFWKYSIDELCDYVTKEIDPDWEIISLYSMTLDYSDKPKVLPIHHFQGTISYLINRKGMENILSKLWNEEEFYLNGPSCLNADHFIYWFAEKHCYMTSMPLLLTAGEDSTIHSEHVAGHMDLRKKIINTYFINNSNGFTI